MKKHIPVLLNESIGYLNLKRNQNYIDATLGFGGHAGEILGKIGPKGRLLGIEWDEDTIEEAELELDKYKNRCTLICENFANLAQIANKTGFFQSSGIIFDLGLNSAQLANPAYGLSFMVDGPLDMRLSVQKAFSNAKEVVNKYSFKKLSDVLYLYGDVRGSRRLAKQIIDFRQARPIETTFQLLEALGSTNPKVLAPIFQALRIEVNHELKNLSRALENSVSILKKGGRLVVLSYHSGEDRIVKNFFRDSQDSFKILTKKPIVANIQEIKLNSRARSAKMRVAEKI